MIETKILPNRENFVRAISKDPDFLIKSLNEDPTIVEWAMKGAKDERKYVKIPVEVQEKLREEAHKRGVAEGLLIGLGIMLLIAILTENR